MANETGGFGLRSVYTLGSSPATQGLSEYPIETAPGKGLYQNDPASKQCAGSIGYLQDAANATMDDGKTGGAGWAINTASILPMTGVFNGAFYIDSATSKPTFANSVAASTTFGTDYNTGSSDGIGFVNDNPQQEYVIKADAIVTQAMIGDAGYNTNSFTAGDAKDGQSTVTLDIGGGADATHMFKLVRSADDPENNDLGAVGANVVVSIAQASNLYN